MDLILLGGNSVSNRAWVEEVLEKLKDLFDNTHIQYYKHWKENKELIDFDYEINELVKNVARFREYVIFAKSVGTLVTIKTILDGRIHPKFCIFVGIPVYWAKEKGFDVDTWFKNFDYPTLVVQNTNDPVCSFKDLETYLKENSVKGFVLKETVGDTHHYPDLEKIHAEVKRFYRAV
jgi:hypothetical protein